MAARNTDTVKEMYMNTVLIYWKVALMRMNFIGWEEEDDSSWMRLECTKDIALQISFSVFGKNQSAIDMDCICWNFENYP